MAEVVQREAANDAAHRDPRTETAALPAHEHSGEEQLHRIVVVGGGAAGLELVTQLGNRLGRRARASVTLVECARTHHFARGFKQSAGVTPHHYLTQKRVERAQDLLGNTDLSLSEIALAVGFSDQSHLARHFRQMLGVTPGQFRWAQR